MESEFESLLDEFDATWEIQRAGPSGIVSFLSSHGLASPGNCGLMSELIQIDIERHWQNWSRQVESFARDATPRACLQKLKSIPRIPNYAIEPLQQVHESRGALLELAACEMRSRDTWGDAAGPHEYQQSFAFELDRRRNYTPPKVRLLCGPRYSPPQFEFPIGGLVLFGRRRNREGSQLEIQEQSCKRIVIADRSEAKISREQLLAQLLSPKFAVITNCSRINPVGIPQSRLLLQPKESVVLPFPFTIQLASRRLVFSS